MSEEVKDTTVNEPSSPTMGDILKGGEETPQTAEVTESVEKPVESTPEPEVKEAAEAPVETKPEPMSTPVDTPPVQPSVPLSAFLAVKNQLKELKDRQSVDSYIEPTPEPAPVTRMDTGTSFKLAQIAHASDWTEKAGIVNEYLKTNPHDEATFNSLATSPDPGEAFYQAGKILLTMKTWGTTDPEQIARLSADKAKKAAFEEGKKAAQAELSEKLKLKSKSPTNILDSRAAGGDEKAEYRSPTIGEILRANKKG
jgi:hypothetical protein